MNILPDTSLYTNSTDRMAALVAIRAELRRGATLQTKEHGGEWQNTLAQPHHDPLDHRDWRCVGHVVVAEAAQIAA